MIRKARDLDAGALGAILSEFIDDTDWMPRIHTRAEDIAFAAQLIRGHKVFVIGAVRPVGFIALDQGSVDAFYVQKDQRGIGHGSKLIIHAQSLYQQLTLWTFQQNSQARKFYAYHGFDEVEFTNGAANDEGLPDVRLIWKAS